MTRSNRRLEVEIARVMSDQLVREWRHRFEALLDYTPESLCKVEEIISRHFPTGEGKFEKIFALKLGYYVGEVVVRTFGGHWVRENDLPAIVGVADRIQAVFPVTKAIKRMLMGPAESFVPYVEEIRKAVASGDGHPETRN